MFLRGVVSAAQVQGPRDYQEDHLVHVPFASARNGKGHLLGVLDGHGGGEVARYCSKVVPRLFDPEAPDIGYELAKIVAQLDARTSLDDAGTTLSLACVNESKRIVTAVVVGDSPVIIVDRNSQVRVSVEHNVRTNEVERQAAIGRGAVYEGGYIYDVSEDGVPSGAGLQLSRALGNRTLRRILSRTPTLSHYRLGVRSVVMVASDGVFDSGRSSIDSRTFTGLLARAAAGCDAEDVLRWREEQGLEDNASLIVWVPRR